MEMIYFGVIAYIFGAIPCGVWIGKIFKNIDIRKYGSYNSGATNAYRVLGRKYGAMVLLLDALKGFIPLLIAKFYGISGVNLIILGFIAILGHSFSIFLKFKGGKGVATSLGVFLFLMPKVIVVLLTIFIVTVTLTKYISLGSIVCSAMLPILAYFMPITYPETRKELVIISFLIGLFVIYKHKTNIVRIYKGEENRFNLRR